MLWQTQGRRMSIDKRPQGGVTIAIHNGEMLLRLRQVHQHGAGGVKLWPSAKQPSEILAANIAESNTTVNALTEVLSYKTSSAASIYSGGSG